MNGPPTRCPARGLPLIVAGGVASGLAGLAVVVAAIGSGPK